MMWMASEHSENVPVRELQPGSFKDTSGLCVDGDLLETSQLDRVNCWVGIYYRGISDGSYLFSEKNNK